MRLKIIITLITLSLLGGCATVVTERMAARLTGAMLDQSDPEIVRAGAPAYLLLLDSLIAEEPDNPKMLLAGARLYSAYAAGLVKNPERQLLLTDIALEYARRALCLEHPALCRSLDLPYRDFATVAEQATETYLPVLFGYATAKLGWIQARGDDWEAVATLPKVELLLQKVVALNPGFERGRAHLYLGALNALRPAALGGKPERAREHFEAAIRFSGGVDLMAKVEYARRYARLVFDQELHDRLLHEVLAAEVHHPGLTLSNVLAQRMARELLRDDYF